MTRLGKVVVTLVVGVVLVGLTVLASHYLRQPSGTEPAPTDDGLPPVRVETPSAESGGGGEASAEADTLADDTADTPPETPADQAKATPSRPTAPPETPPEVAPDTPSTPPSPADGQAGETDAPTPDIPAGDEDARAGLAMREDRPIVAQKLLSGAVKAGISGALAVRVNEAIRDLANRLQLAKDVNPQDPYSKRYTVRQGDNLTAIGKRFLIPYPLVQRLNGLETTAIRAGQQVKVIQGPVHVEVFKRQFQLRVWLGEVCLRVYPVGVGLNNSTPEGTFNVKNKVKNPPYQPQHKTAADFRAGGAPDNPLGSRWIDIGNHYGIHGTIEPESIGKDVSEGCIRMHNSHVEELYDLVIVGATKVYIWP